MAEGGFGCTDTETGSVPRHRGLYGRHPQNYVERVSVEVNTIMTRLGYGEEMRRWRVEKYRETDRLINSLQIGETMITAGSKAEGLTCYNESDHDLLSVANNVLCVEAGINLHTIPGYIEVYRMDTRVYPGHCKLLLERKASRFDKPIYNALCDDGYGNGLLSSSLYLDELSSLVACIDLTAVEQRAGPSLPATFAGTLCMDRVSALRCRCPSILQRWAARPRHWPSPVIVQTVVSLGAIVTPVGFKGSENKHMEWRINFNTGETELVNNLNETQAKVYVILKMTLKDILKPKNKEITSYTLKNIVLWQAEHNPQTQFNACSLLHWLHDGLRELRTAIAKKHMPYYMIPERNLMEACGISDKLQNKWVADITDMLEEGPGVILRLKKIRKAIVASPEPMLWYSKKRMELEMLFLEMRITWNSWTDVNAYLNIINKIIEVQQRMLLEGSSVNDLIYICKAMLM
ncbi:uncharacterized protein LOC127839231 [Dreissena polymorpha]|uniref:Mab-21-like HhH/H2TH-like domain-containing protein n=1 Tax=Dreissena polymorpha TaxID=45954 RepID=A0A9D4FJF5_DREPO|nr:uncharacterized protein LOC127839231 [Dreissena polymorpha]XP_052223475.1 uncharacterized protein LOC127839231 [Dreissena polymorpha]KAH3796922.1 hypothetical protein DPMN_150499 [Dreissena polymorpha]